MSDNLDRNDQRLKDRVVEAALEWARVQAIRCQSQEDVAANCAAYEALKATTLALRAYEARSSTPEAVWNLGDKVLVHGEVSDYGSGKLCIRTRGTAFWIAEKDVFRRDAPSQDTEVEKSRSVGALSDEDAAKIGRSLMATIDANREHPLLKDWTPAEDPAEIVGDLLAFDTPRFPDNTAEQVYPSDAEIYDEWVDWFGGMLKSRKKDIYEFARAILSKSRPSISPETLHKLWSLAQTEAQEQFMIDARGILSGAGKA